jgi:methylglutaconyl-CoA hydratase
LDSPHNRNALSAELCRQLAVRLRSALEDDAVRAIVLTHTGPLFCSGADLKAQDPGAAARGDFPAVLQAIWTSPKPVIARLAGPARGGGVGLVAACDFAVASDEVLFALSEVRIGVVAAVISVTVLPRMLPHAAYELFLTGEPFDATRAVNVGLLNSAVVAERLDAEVDRYLRMVFLAAPGALSATKRMLREPRPTSLEEDLAQQARLAAERFASAEGQEGIRAFLEKRPPEWALTPSAVSSLED